MPATLSVYENNSGSVGANSTSTPVTVTVPQDMWDSWLLTYLSPPGHWVHWATGLGTVQADPFGGVTILEYKVGTGPWTVGPSLQFGLTTPRPVRTSFSTFTGPGFSATQEMVVSGILADTSQTLSFRISNAWAAIPHSTSWTGLTIRLGFPVGGSVIPLGACAGAATAGVNVSGTAVFNGSTVVLNGYQNGPVNARTLKLFWQTVRVSGPIPSTAVNYVIRYQRTLADGSFEDIQVDTLPALAGIVSGATLSIPVNTQRILPQIVGAGGGGVTNASLSMVIYCMGRGGRSFAQVVG